MNDVLTFVHLTFMFSTFRSSILKPNLSRRKKTELVKKVEMEKRAKEEIQLNEVEMLLLSWN